MGIGHGPFQRDEKTPHRLRRLGQSYGRKKSTFGRNLFLEAKL